jgi:putative peptidoglycan lipid II flippase
VSGEDRSSGAGERNHLAEEVAFAGAVGDDEAVVALTEQDLSAERGDDGLAARRSRSLLQASALPAVGTSLSRATGLLRIAALTAALGLSEVADVYNLANTTPNILYELVLGGVLSSTLVPLFVRSLDDPDDDTASVLTTVSFVAIVALTLALTLLAPVINLLFALPLEGEQRRQQLALGDDLMGLLLPQVLFYGLVTLFTALLHARRRFAPPAFAPILTNVITAAAALISVTWIASDRSTLQLWVLGLGTTLGVAAMAFALVPSLRRSDLRLRWRFRPRHPAVRQLLSVSGWVVGFAAANQVAFLIILGLAVTLQPGTLSAFTYAFAFFQLPYGLIAVSITTASLPELAEAATDGRTGDFRRRFTEGTSLLLAFMVPSAVGVVLLARPLVQLVLQRGSFTAADTALTAEMLQGFAVGLPAFAVYLFVVRAFYARRDTRTPFWLNLTQNILNVAIMFPLTAALDAAGLALAYSLSYWVIVVAALVALHRAVRRDGGEEPGALLGRAGLTALARSVAVGAVVAVALVATFEILRPASEDRALLEVVVGLAVGLAAFVGATFLLRPSGFEPAVDRLRRGWRSRGRSMSN